MTPDNIISRFKAKVNIPFNPSVISEKAYAPSCQTEIEKMEISLIQILWKLGSEVQGYQ